MTAEQQAKWFAESDAEADRRERKLAASTLTMRAHRRSVRIEITQADIDAGVQRDWECCPFAIALRRRQHQCFAVLWGSGLTNSGGVASHHRLNVAG